ncbi:M14 family metallopeptidase [Salegentibacter sp. HM20]
MKFLKFSLLFFLIVSSAQAQVPQLYKELFESWPKYKAEGFETRRFKHSQVKKSLENLSSVENFEISQVGTSIEGRELYLLSTGTGDIDVFLWSQMHGDESTATMALFDIFNFLKSEDYSEEKKEMLSRLKLHFLPMLNPDGAEKFQRRNALGVDLNRDALRLQNPESKTLKRIRDSLDADFGFNLHDQSKYYNASRTEKPATISFLAPAYNYEKEINEVRGDAMKLIVEMNKLLQELIPGQVGRYNDDFEPRAFGDNIQKWGTSTILIESGGYPGDPEKQEIRRLNFSIILASLFAIADESYKMNELESYEEIPNNDRMLFDLKLEALSYELHGNEYIIDLGINHSEVEVGDDFYYRGYIADRGDLSTSYGYADFNAAGYKIVEPKVYGETLEKPEDLKDQDLSQILNDGFAYVKLKNLPEDVAYSEMPVNFVGEDFEAPQTLTPTFFLEKEGSLKYAVINGFLIDLSSEILSIENALILK